MIWFLLVFAALAVLAMVLYMRRKRERLRERMALLRFEMGQYVRELKAANAEAEEAICSDYR